MNKLNVILSSREFLGIDGVFRRSINVHRNIREDVLKTKKGNIARKFQGYVPRKCFGIVRKQVSE
jgi:hypothetical protein